LPYETQVTWSVGANTEVTPWGLRSVLSRAFEQRAEEYCYEVKLRSLADGAETTLPRRCVAAGEQPPLVRAATAQDLRAPLLDCNEPPDGYLAEWCVARAECASGIKAGWCGDYEAKCPAELRPGAGGAGGADGDPSAGAAGLSEPDAHCGNGAVDEDSSGCSTALGSRARASSLVGILALVGWLGRRRRSA
jgi:hypothetical protein